MFFPSAQSNDSERQKQFVANYAKEKGHGEVQIISDIDSGLNENRNLPILYVLTVWTKDLRDSSK